MAMPQRDDLIEEIKRTDLLLEWAVQHGDEAEAERLREKLRKVLSGKGHPGVSLVVLFDREFLYSFGSIIRTFCIFLLCSLDA